MASTSQKPLPSIPRRPDVPRNLTSLTVEGREHLRKIIESCLVEIDQTVLSDSGRGSWSKAVENSLDDLGANIAKGGWLTGVKRSRVAQKAKRAEETKKVEAQMATKESEETAKSKGKGKVDLVQEAPRREDKELPKDPQNSPTLHADGPSLALQQIRDIVARPTLPTPKPLAKHLLLCLAPIGRDMPIEDSGFDIVPHSASCAFTPGVFSLPESLSNGESGILFGLNEWDATLFSPDDDSIRVVGGTFVFKGVTSAAAHSALSTVLRIAIYVHLSIILEQYLLVDSNVALNISKPQSSPLIKSYPSSPILTRPPTPPGARRRLRDSISPSGIMSFLSKKAENILHKTAGIGPNLGRSGSLDIRPSSSGLTSARSSIDKPRARLRGLSFRSSPSTPLQNEVTSAPDAAFTVIVKRLEESKDVLSSSPGVSLSPPALLVALAAKEKSSPSHIFRADERAGLKSIRGWDENDSEGTGMTGTLGFVRQQEFSVLHSRHVPSALPHPPSDGSPSTQNPPAPTYVPCDKPRWITYQFYSRDKGSDKTLGDAVADLCSAADKPCDTNGCQFKRGEHELRMIHGGLRIVLKVEAREISDESSQNDIIEMWESCKTCGAVTRRHSMSDGTYLVSFAKFLELLCYSPAICTVTPTLCEHTTPPSRLPDFQLPKSRLEIIRNFSFQSHIVTVELSSVDDILDLRLPRLQILRNNDSSIGSNMTSGSSAISECAGISDASAEEEKKALKREIKSWWQGVSEHIDKLEVNFTRGRPEPFSKSLPRLPSTEDELDTSTTVTPKARTSGLPSPNSGPESIVASESSTPKARAHTLPPLPSDTSDSAPNNILPSHKSQNAPPPIPEKDSKGTDSKGTGTDSLQRLQGLRHSFQRTEQSLYALLSRTPISSLNDVRTAFLSAARGATRRLSAWQKKHLRHAIKGQLTIGDLSVPEPEWWHKSCHAIPGGNIIVREADWGSIIAFTLSSADYQRELAGMSVKTATPIPSVASPSLSTPTNQSSFFGTNAAYKLFSSSSVKPDPDQEGIIWHEPETYSAVISRKEHPRDHTSLLSIREVLRSRPAGEGSDDSQSRNIGSGLPPSAWAKPSVETNKYAAGGVVSGLPEVDSVGKLLHEIENASTDSSHPSSVSGSDTSKSQFGDAHIRRAQASSLLSGESDSTVGPDDRECSITDPPALPPKGSEPSSPPAQTSSFFTSSVTTGLTNAMRFMLNTGESLRSSSPTFKHKHNLMSTSTDPPSIDERPHIKYDWMIGKRLKFSCTVYYAKQFDGLRRRCGIEDVFLRSVGRSSNWAAEGGKSKSNFWKTSDDRFIIKTLVNAWNVADLAVLIELAPSYFRHMESTWTEPSALAKVLGFYTVEIKNLESGNTQAKVDLLLMENLFYNQKIGKTFDLKGIQGRKVKAASSSSSGPEQNKTLFDGEWIEGQQRTLMLVPPHSKVVLNEAVRNDSNFLSKNNIMDYSLLLGVDAEQKQIICGLVDTIGSYTFAKTLEYKAKQGLNAGKDVTVIPPVEYQGRFMKALDGYFLACPDKWSQPLDGGKVPNDASLLPCVL